MNSIKSGVYKLFEHAIHNWWKINIDILCNRVEYYEVLRKKESGDKEVKNSFV